MIDLIDTIKKSLKTHKIDQKKYVLAISGGVDSMALLQAFIKLNEHFVVAHFDHGVRQTSHEDAKFVADFCKQHGLKYISKRWQTVPNNPSEALMREARYAFLKEVLEKENAVAIVTAHHLDDQAETIFMRFLRGTGIKGFGGIKTYNNKLFRPFLNVSKNDIVQFAKKHAVPFREDSTNTDTHYYRNNIRHNVIPHIKTLNPHFLENIALFTSEMQELYEFLEIQRDLWIETYVINKSFTKNVFLALPKFLKGMVIMKLADANSVESRKNIDEVLRITQEGNNGARVCFGEIEFICQYERVSFQKKSHEDFSEEVSNFHIQLNQNEIISINGDFECSWTVIERNVDILEKDTNTIYVDFEKIQGDVITVRSWQSGDIFQPLGMLGSQKIQDFFVNQKIPSSQRKKIPLFVDSQNKIIAVGNLRMGEPFKITKNTKKLIQITCIDKKFQ